MLTSQWLRESGKLRVRLTISIDLGQYLGGDAAQILAKLKVRMTKP